MPPAFKQKLMLLRKKRNSLNTLGTLQLRSDFTQKVSPQCDITRSKDRIGREKEMY